MKYIEIENFKNFKHLKIDNLGKVNLIVGRNNVGKSTLLEAISILVSGASIGWIKTLLEIRGLNPRVSIYANQPELIEFENFGSLYNGRDYDRFSNVPIRFTSGAILPDEETENSIEIKLVELVQVIETNDDGTEIRKRMLKSGLADANAIIVGEQSWGLQISFNGMKTLYQFGSAARRPYSVERNIPFEYVRTAEFMGDRNAFLFDKVALSPLEPILVEALKIIDTKITALNFLNDESRPDAGRPREQDNRVPFVILDNSPQKIRLSTMGDGINRILTIILSMVNCRNGVLLVDEFENGLHYTVQTQLWDLIFSLADKLNVQVFATTHSQDCIKSFLRASRDYDNARLIRLESRAGGEVAVVYDETDEFEYIIDNDVETR